ncbi:MAG: glycosyltransferase family 1 protein [Verrucomicrobiota bacterium]
MKIGFDVAQTCVTRTGCGWYADALIRAMAAAAPENEYYLYHRFGRWKSTDPCQGTLLHQPGVHMPYWSPENTPPAAHPKKKGATNADLPGSPDIVQSNSFQAPAVGSARLVVVVYDVSFWVYPEFTTEANRQACQRGVCEALDRADGFLFISQSSMEEFERILPGWLERNHRLAAAIPLASRISAEPKEEPGAYWLAVGSLEPRKNYGTLLSAMELYWKRSSRRIPLHLAGGKGWCNQDLLARIAALKKTGMVRLLNYVADEALPELYASAMGLIFPSWYEGFGLPVLEAMQCGCPVISSGRTSLSEVGGDAVMTIGPESPASICEAMLRMESDAAFRRCLVAAAKQRAERFSWEATAKATLDFYRKILTQPPASLKR